MAHDQQTYLRGRNAASIGLAAQFLLAVVAAFLGLASGAFVVNAAALHLFGGLPIWIILILIYNQQRLERIESLEAEEIARQDQRAAAIFDQHADELDLSRRRVDKLVKWGLGIVSVLVAVYLIGLGGWYFIGAWQSAQQAVTLGESSIVMDAMREDASPTVVMVVAIGIAFVLFICARYLAGMTRVREWQLLRGGASYMMGNFLVVMLIVIAAGLAGRLGSTLMLGLLSIIVPAIMVLIGVEILLMFMLGAYRPRRPGEIPRPAFDSRVLGLLTSPESLGKIISETLNYQFGFEISRSWFYRLMGRAITPLTAIAIIVLLAFSCIVIVEPGEQAIITTNGGKPRVVDAGMHTKLPWPIGKVETFATGEVRQIWVGSSRAKTDLDVAILWTTDHHSGPDVQYLITAPSSKEQTVRAADGGTADASVAGMSLLAGEVVVQYRIDDLMAYSTSADHGPADHFPSQYPDKNHDELLRLIADSRVTEHFSSHDIDTLLGDGRIVAGEVLRESIQADADALNMGLQVLFVGITGVHPPAEQEVAKSFHAEIGALSEKQAKIEDARKREIEILASVAGSQERSRSIFDAILEYDQLKRQMHDAEDDAAREKLDQLVTENQLSIARQLEDASGEAAQVILAALAYRWEKSLGETAAAARFETDFQAFHAAPDYYRWRLYLNTLADGLAIPRKYIITSRQSEPPVIEFDLHDARTALGDLFDTLNQ
jgi:regulator of protease activity HflC (stomatin/prohibitin superfamily)